MRINFKNSTRINKQGNKLLLDLCQQFADEYLIADPREVLRNLWAGDQLFNQTFGEHFQKLEWKIQYYKIPEVGERTLSHGLWFDDECDKLMCWRITQE